MMSLFKHLRAICAAIPFIGHAAAAQEPPEVYPVEAFGALPLVSNIRLSPDGSHIAYLTSVMTGRRALFAHPLSGPKEGNTLALAHQDKADISRFLWANDNRLLVTYSFYAGNSFYKGQRIEQTRLVSAAFKGKSFNVIKPSKDQTRIYGRSRAAFAGNQSNIVDLLHHDPMHVLVALDDDLDGDPDIRSVNIETGRFSTVQAGYQDIYNWIADSDGQAALGWSFHEEDPHLHLPKDKRKIWSRDAIYSLLERGYTPLEIHQDGQSAIFYTMNQFGRWGLARFSLVTGDLIDWIYSHKTYDLDEYIRSDITGRIVGVGYTDTVSRQIFIDGIEKKIHAAVSKALTDSSVRLISSDKAGTLFLFDVETPRQTPKVFSFDLRAKTLSELSDPYENIEDEDVAPVRMHVVTMRDGLEIEVYVTTPIGRGEKNLPTIMMPHGGPAGRDSAEFDYLAQMLANRGYLILQPNFRGSAGYGEAFEDLSDSDWGGAMQDDLTDTMAWAVDSGIADAQTSCIVGWSYGGYAALMGAVKTPDQFNCAVSINGVANLPGLWTRDGNNFVGGKKWRKSIGEQRDELKDISPFHRAAEIKVPVLLIAAKDDWRVDYRQSKKMFKRLKSINASADYVEVKLGGHSLDVDSGRVKAFTALVDFLEAHIGGEADAH